MNPPAFKRWLIVSLAINVFVIGGVAGGAWRWWTAERSATPAAVQNRGLRYAADELPSEQRQAYRLRLRDARQNAAGSIQASREGRQEVLRLMRAPQFDPAATAAALARIREADSASRVRFETSVIEFASTLSPAERQKLANGLARRGTPPPAAPSRP